jgi:hypothetical protein
MSLGYNCWSATCGVWSDLRGMKRDGAYETCPFDLMLSSPEGVARCLEAGLESMYDPAHLRLVRAPGGTDERTGRLRSSTNPHTHVGCVLLVHAEYGFVFSHESPDSLHVVEKWEGGATHFVDDGYREFVARYARRCANMRAYVRDAAERGLPLHFTLTVPKGMPEVAEAAHRRLRAAVVDHLLPPGSPDPHFALFEEDDAAQYLSDMELVDTINRGLCPLGPPLMALHQSRDDTV